MKNFHLPIFSLISCLLLAQDSTALYFANSINTQDLQTHLYVLASDSLEGRETGKKGQKLAADYIATYFTSIGIPPYNGTTYYQEFPLLKQSLKTSSLLLKDSLVFLEDYYTSPFFSSVNIDFTSIQCIGYGIEGAACSLFKEDLKDKVVLIFTSNLMSEKEKLTTINEPIGWEQQLEIAYKKGVKAVLFIDEDVKNKCSKYGSYFTKEKRSVLINNAKFKVPFAFIDAADLKRTIGWPLKRLKKKVRHCKYPTITAKGSFSTYVNEDEDTKDRIAAMDKFLNRLDKEQNRLQIGFDSQPQVNIIQVVQEKLSQITGGATISPDGGYKQDVKAITAEVIMDKHNG